MNITKIWANFYGMCSDLKTDTAYADTVRTDSAHFDFYKSGKGNLPMKEGLQ